MNSMMALNGFKSLTLVAPTSLSLVLGGCKLMSPFTQYLTSVLGGRIISAQGVFASSGFLNMYRVNALSVPAKVISFSITLDNGNEHSINDSVGIALSSVKIHSSVATFRKVACPDPAGSVMPRDTWIDFYPAEYRGQYGTSNLIATVDDLRCRVRRAPFTHITVSFLLLDCLRIVWNHLSLLNRFIDGLGFRGLIHREALSF